MHLLEVVETAQLGSVNSASTRSDPYEVGSQCLGLWTPSRLIWSCAHRMILGDKGRALGSQGPIKKRGCPELGRTPIPACKVEQGQVQQKK